MPYFIRVKGKAFGPFDETQILDMKAKGKISRTTEMSGDKLNWQSAETYPWLFEPLHPQGSPAADSGSNEPKDWYYSTNGKEGYGPVPAATIMQMLQSGELSLNSYVWQDGQNARFVKDEPMFQSPPNGGKPHSPNIPQPNIPPMNAEEMMLRPLAASLGWLMFLKIVYLIAMILWGLGLIVNGIFTVSQAFGADSAWFLLSVLFFLAVAAAFYALNFKAFLCFWKYHVDVQQAASSRTESDLARVNQSAFLLWKWLGINTIVGVSVMLLALIIGIIVTGFSTGLVSRF
jgi:hypothetical protein